MSRFYHVDLSLSVFLSSLFDAIKTGIWRHDWQLWLTASLNVVTEAPKFPKNEPILSMKLIATFLKMNRYFSQKESLLFQKESIGLLFLKINWYFL